MTEYYQSDDPRFATSVGNPNRDAVVAALLAQQRSLSSVPTVGHAGGGSLGDPNVEFGVGFDDFGGGDGFQQLPSGGQLGQPQFQQPPFQQQQPQPQPTPPAQIPLPPEDPRLFDRRFQFGDQVPLPQDDPRSFGRRFDQFPQENFNDRFPDPRVFTPSDPGFSGNAVPFQQSRDFFGADREASIRQAQQPAQDPQVTVYTNAQDGVSDSYPNDPFANPQTFTGTTVQGLTPEMFFTDPNNPYSGNPNYTPVTGNLSIEDYYAGGTPFYDSPYGGGGRRGGGGGTRSQVE